jgi:uncharacterized Zn-binding protein involved in type VI secretion
MQYGVAKVGVSQGGGGILMGGDFTVLIEGSPCGVIFDKLTPHGESPHATAIFPPQEGNPQVLVGGKPILREVLSKATCQHPLTLGAATVKTS